MKKIRFAVLGCGGFWNTVCGIYAQHPRAEFTAFCDNAEGKAAAAAGHFKKLTGRDVRIYASYEEMIKKASYDAVIICSDPDSQVDYAVSEMDRGVHVMTSVPAAWTIDQCFRLVEAVEKNGVKYQLAEQTRYWHFISLWRRMAERGELGKIYYAEAEYLHYEPEWDWFRNKKTGARLVTGDPKYHTDPDYEPSWRYRTFADPIWYLPHSLSPLLSITGGRIDRVSCVGTRKDSYYTKGFKARDLECALMYNTDDVIFSLRAGFVCPHGMKRDTGAHWYQVKGTGKCVEWARTSLEDDCAKSYSPAEGWVKHPEWGCRDPEAAEEFARAEHGGADYYPMYYFMDALLGDKQPPLDVYKAVETAAPAILARESAERGGELLRVPDFREKRA
ncbi:MAG: Gfo/Idh/MocA family oxidoreductase [Abditibacteriota bacterium]|nr:Gfo/Idh/MocA family oxidoreductase [Abditibacteriota bacterium]